MDNNMYEQSQNVKQENTQYSSYYEAPAQPQVQMPIGSELEEPVSLGEWLIAMLLMCIPCVNIVLMFVWAFGGSVKKSKSNFFKASLIATGVYMVLCVIMVILMSVGMLAGFSSMM